MCAASEEFGASHGENGIGEKSRQCNGRPGDDRQQATICSTSTLDSLSCFTLLPNDFTVSRDH
jgi:hypothetical protein